MILKLIKFYLLIVPVFFLLLLSINVLLDFLANGDFI